MNRQTRGQAGETLAARFLETQGYRLVERNWRAGGGLRGEIDCIAWHGKVLCFVEVKTRVSDEHGAPQQAVTPAKQRQLSRLANAYISLHRLDDTPCRFDVIEVWLNPPQPPRLALHQNAFDYQGESTFGRSSRVF